MKRNWHAFTLIECVLALGITATMLVAILGLLPTGLEATRTAAHREAEAHIIEQVRQACATTQALGDRWFDASGARLRQPSTGTVFTVRVAQTEDVTLPGDAIASMRRIRITISDRHAGDPFDDARHLRTHHVLLSPLSAAPP